MKRSLNDIASDIEMNIIGGLKGAYNNNSYSLAQIKSDILSLRSVIGKELLNQRKIEQRDLAQWINCIEIKCSDIGQCCDIDVSSADMIKIPRLASVFSDKAIVYLGTPTKQKPFKVVYEGDFLYNKYTRTANLPYVWFSDLETGWVFNKPSGLEMMSIYAIFDDPYQLNNYSCCTPILEDDPFPASEEIINMIIEQLTNRFVNIYRKMNNLLILPNTGNSQI